MQIGCGIRTMTVKDREYVYFWHYETKDGRRKAVHDYVGPAKDPESGRKAVEALEAYTRRAMEDARHRLQALRARAMAGSR
jgi:hypothetical protein